MDPGPAKPASGPRAPKPLRPVQAIVVGTILAVTALALVSIFVLRRPGVGPGAGTAPARARPHSFWRVTPQPAQPAAEAAAPAPARPSGDRAPSLAILVEDATGGPIAGATVDVAERALGLTDQEGWLRVPANAVPRTGGVTVTAPGYATGTTTYASPGEARVQLLPGSQISGVAVEAGTGRPVSDLLVTAAEAETTTDRAGRFAFRDLGAGILQLQARGPHHFGSLPAPIAVGLGKVVANLRLEVMPAFTIRGRVSAGGDPVPGRATVYGASTAAPVDDNGHYELRGVLPGRHELSLRGHAAAEFMSLRTPIPVTITDSDIRQDIELGPRLQLTVELVDPRGRALADREVQATWEDDDRLISNRCMTKANGRCTFSGLQRGQVELEVGGGAPARKVALPAADPVQFVVDAEGVIAGRLAGADGRAPRARGVFIEGRRGTRDSVTSAADGSFSFPHLPADHYQLQVRADRHMWGGGEAAEATAQLPLGAGEHRSDLMIELAPEDGLITGQVVDAAGRPLGDVLIAIDVFRRNVFTTGAMVTGKAMRVTGPDGRFAFERLMRAQRYVVTAHHSDGRQARQIDLPSQSTVTMRLIELARLSVTLQNPAGQPRNGLVEIVDGDTVLDIAFFDNTSDVIRFDTLTPGRRLIRVHSRSVGGGKFVNLEPGQLTTATLTVD